MRSLDNPELQLAFDFVQNTNKNIFLTGKAGTGKTTFLKNLRQQTHKRVIVVAPTGVAAINAGGVTIHSFFQLSFGPQLQNEDNSFYRFRDTKINIIRSLDLLIIDEISMVRADLLDGIDRVLRRFRRRDLPFGGVQLLMIGDLQQLAPVIADSEWELLKPHYDTCYFFSSNALKEAEFLSIELKHIYRQSDKKFIDLLNRIRTNRADATTLSELNKRYISDFQPKEDEKYITLTTHNYQAKAINQGKLDEKREKLHVFKAIIKDDFPEYMYPTEFNLELKVGAQVMFVKNDSSADKRFYNGKIGTIVGINREEIEVKCPGESETITTVSERWENTSYELNAETQEIEEKIQGSFEQFPLKLAWAITIHKSQGLTFERAIINARQSFAPGQVYVALSRCKSLEGLVLSAPLNAGSIHADETVDDFTKSVEQNQPDVQVLSEYQRQFQQQLISELFDFRLLTRLVQYMLKLCREQGALLLGNLNSTLLSMVQPIKTEMIDVSVKFEKQIGNLLKENPDVGQNEQLQERIKKACTYFSKKLITIVIEPLRQANFETDNKTVRKSFQKGMENLYKEINIKEKTLEVCKGGFNIELYLKTRAITSIASGQFTQTTSNSSKHPDFYKQLFNWRAKKAKALLTDTSRILRQQTILAIANELPSTRLELKNTKGVGGTKLKQFGKEILEMVIDYRREKGMELPLEPQKEAENAAVDSKHLSFELFKIGKAITVIAKERSMAVSTIEGHLAHFVGTGELSIDSVVDSAKKDTIQKFIESHPHMDLSEIKIALGSQYSYGEIRNVINYLKHLKTKQ